MPNSKKSSRMAPAHSGPKILGRTPKFKIQLVIFSSPSSEISKMVCQTSVGQKLRVEMDFLETCLFQPGLYHIRLS